MMKILALKNDDFGATRSWDSGCIRCAAVMKESSSSSLV